MSERKRSMISDALRLLRLYLGLSQKQMAATLDLSQSMISEIENGTKAISLETLERYSSSFDIPMSKLMFFAEELQENPQNLRGKLIVAPKIISILEALAPKEIADASY